MKKLDAQSLDQLLDAALDNAEPGFGLVRLAGQVFDEKNAALEALIKQWAIERILTLLRRKRLERGRKTQLRLPGFEAIPLRVPGADGKGRPLLRSTYEDLRRYHVAVQAKAERDPKLVQLEALMKLMSKHRGKGITVQEVLEREGIQPRLPE